MSAVPLTCLSAFAAVSFLLVVFLAVLRVFGFSCSQLAQAYGILPLHPRWTPRSCVSVVSMAFPQNVCDRQFRITRFSTTMLRRPLSRIPITSILSPQWTAHSHASRILFRSPVFQPSRTFFESFTLPFNQKELRASMTGNPNIKADWYFVYVGTTIQTNQFTD